MTVPEGFREEWVPDEGWTTDPEVIGGKLCRRLMGGSPRKLCGRPAVAALNRRRWTDGGRAPSWWCYCDDPDHLYGRRIVDGVVLGRRLVPLDGADAEEK